MYKHNSVNIILNNVNIILNNGIIMEIFYFQRYIVASIGSGFTIYDIETGQTVLRKEHAHHSKINDITFTCEG
jgi:hypothetical protein